LSSEDTGTKTYFEFKSTAVFEQATATVVVAEEVSANVIVPEPACTASEKVRRYVKSFRGL
jgi:hypothetical protein